MRVAYAILASVLACQVFPTLADGVVMCARKKPTTGLLVEGYVDPVALGLQGPQGEVGPQGPPGPPPSGTW